MPKVLRKEFVCIALVFICISTLAQATPVPLIHTDSVYNELLSTGGIDPYRLTGIAVGTAAGFVWGHAVQNDLWWKGTLVPFHVNVQQDWRYALGADKLGHAVFPFFTSRLYEAGFRWSGMDTATAVWAASSVALAYQTYIEVRDGFSRDYGFSPADMAANTIGAALPVAQHYFADLRPFTLQISYWPSQAFRNGQYNAIIDDYTSTTHWLSVSVKDVVPTSWTWYPAWLNVALGHSVENIDGTGGGNHVLLLGLDWNLQRIPGVPAWLREVLRVLHAYHLPAPAVRLYPSVAWFGLRM